MPLGPGKYDDACSAAVELTEAAAIVLIVLDGKHGSGFSVQSRVGIINPAGLPRLLRMVADDIEASINPDAPC